MRLSPFNSVFFLLLLSCSVTGIALLTHLSDGITQHRGYSQTEAHTGLHTRLEFHQANYASLTDDLGTARPRNHSKLGNLSAGYEAESNTYQQPTNFAPVETAAGHNATLIVNSIANAINMNKRAIKIIA